MNKTTNKTMKRALNFAACTLLALATATSGNAALAANLQFTPQPATNGGAIYGRIPLNKLGTLSLPRGRATFKSHTVEISAVAEYQFERQTVLSGPVLKCSAIQNGKQTVVNGIDYFQDGDWLRYLDNTAADKITTTATTYEGQITALKKGFVEITTGQLVTNVPTDQILSITSPRAYNFSMVVTPYLSAPAGEPLSGDAELVSMRPTADVLSLSVVKRDPIMASDGDMSTKKLVVLGTFLAAAQISQFIPMAIVFGPLRNQQVQQYHSRMANYYNQVNTLTIYNANGGLYPITPYAPGALPSGGGL
ncbi:MAG: hypothetical protein JSS86_07525 [Cyanobacteria bacterium SZAS LIN-2]|nr:hypothetical protein [Cyanobacteria bacterium SZAS LIN-2]